MKNPQKKKSFLARLVENLDRKMEKNAKEKSCSNNKGKSCCSQL